MNTHQALMTMAMVASTSWKPVLASYVNVAYYKSFTDSNCATPTGHCDNSLNGHCQRILDECVLRVEYSNIGQMHKYVHKNNKIYEQWFNSPTCSGAPDAESIDVGGATPGSVGCNTTGHHYYKSVSVGQIPANQCEITTSFNDSACTLSRGSSSTCKGPIKCSSELIPHLSKIPQAPSTTKATISYCSNNKYMTAFYETSNCDGCPSVVLDVYSASDNCEAKGSYSKKRSRCANQAFQPDSTSQQCLQPGGQTNEAAGKSKFILAVFTMYTVTCFMV